MPSPFKKRPTPPPAEAPQAPAAGPNGGAQVVEAHPDDDRALAPMPAPQASGLVAQPHQVGIGAGTGQLASIARSTEEVRAMILIAQHTGRDEKKAAAELMAACADPSVAEDACYAFPRGTKEDGTKNIVSGPSVYLAREGARCWGHLRTGIRILWSTDTHEGICGFAFDALKNRMEEFEDTFEKLILRKGKGWIKPDERELRELRNRRGAICVRNAILCLLPAALVNAAVRKAQETLRGVAQGRIQKDAAGTAAKMQAAFGKLGVTPAMLATYLGHPADQVNAEELADLQQVYASIADGHTRPGDHFEAPPPPSTAQVDPAQAVAAASSGPGVKVGPGVGTTAPGAAAASPPAAPKPPAQPPAAAAPAPPAKAATPPPTTKRDSPAAVAAFEATHRAAYDAAGLDPQGWEPEWNDLLEYGKVAAVRARIEELTRKAGQAQGAAPAAAEGPKAGLFGG